MTPSAALFEVEAICIVVLEFTNFAFWGWSETSCSRPDNLGGRRFLERGPVGIFAEAEPEWGTVQQSPERDRRA